MCVVGVEASVMHDLEDLGPDPGSQWLFFMLDTQVSRLEDMNSQTYSANFKLVCFGSSCQPWNACGGGVERGVAWASQCV